MLTNRTYSSPKQVWGQWVKNLQLLERYSRAVETKKTIVYPSRMKGEVSSQRSRGLKYRETR